MILVLLGINKPSGNSLNMSQDVFDRVNRGDYDKQIGAFMESQSIWVEIDGQRHDPRKVADLKTLRKANGSKILHLGTEKAIPFENKK